MHTRAPLSVATGLPVSGLPVCTLDPLLQVRLDATVATVARTTSARLHLPMLRPGYPRARAGQFEMPRMSGVVVLAG
jgi:hypothetical protein